MGTSAPSSDLRVAIIGSGFGGIAAAVRLIEDGVTDVTLLERAADTGGTWRDNTYPGAACDIPSHLYSLSFAPKADWSRRYAPQAEIREYADRVVAEHGLRARTLFGFEVTAGTWDETTATWRVEAADGRVVVADVVVNAVGALKDPAYPAIDGLEDFEGTVMHSAEWDHDVPLAGRRIGAVGTGASAIQFVPRVAGVADHLTVFQRTAAWIVPRGDRAFTAAEKAAFRFVPGARLLRRGYVFAKHELERWAFTEGTPLHEGATRLATAHRYRQVRDPELREALTPDYPFGCKRVLRSDDYYPAIARDDVTLETTGIARVTPTGVELDDGRHVELDVLLLGTGFKVSDPLNGMVVTGRRGRDLETFWGGRPSAHLGITVPGFPNFFMLLGPNQGLGHNSVLLMIEAALEHVRDAVRILRDDRVDAIDVTQEAHDRFVAWIDEQTDGTSWAGGCASWYLTDEGENFSLWPQGVLAYRRATARVDLDEHVLTHHAGRHAPDAPPIDRIQELQL